MCVVENASLSLKFELALAQAFSEIQRPIAKCGSRDLLLLPIPMSLA